MCCLPSRSYILTQVLKLGRLQYVCVILFWCFNILHLILHLSILIPRHQWVPIWIPSLSHSTGGTFHQSKAALHEDGLPESGIGNGKMIKYICSVDGRNPAPNWYVVFLTVDTKVYTSQVVRWCMMSSMTSSINRIHCLLLQGGELWTNIKVPY